MGRLSSAENRMTELNQSTDGCYSEDFTYDLAGNIIVHNAEKDGVNRQLGYTYNGNHIASVSQDGNSVGTAQYDSRGNITRIPGENLQIAYNLCNLPQSITTGNGTSVNYGYLSDGIKYRAVSDSGEKYLYAGSLRFRIDNNNVVPESFAIAGGRVNYNGGSRQTNYYITDHLGSVRAVTDAMGNVLAEFDYTSYGELLAATDNTATGIDRLFTGKEQQGKLGASELYDSHARFMNTTGRFLSMDPLAEKYYHLSPYAYCAGDPVNLVDPDGKELMISDENGKWFFWKEVDGKWGFYDYDNNVYSGDLETIKEYSSALTILMGTATGAELVKELAKEDGNEIKLYSRNINNKEEKLSSHYAPKAKQINWLYTEKDAEYVETENGSDQNIVTNLGHELAHALYHKNGGDVNRRMNHSVDIYVSEVYTTHIENKIRAELKEPLRTYYMDLPIIERGKSLYYNTSEETEYHYINKHRYIYQ
jgi:RHS repeat-associated protein